MPARSRKAETGVPPQSMSVSSPFFTPSAGARMMHLPLVQIRSTQSADFLQPLPMPQAAALLPPQSMSVSSAFFAPSVGEGA